MSYDYAGNIDSARSEISAGSSVDLRKFSYVYDKANRLLSGTDSLDAGMNEYFSYDSNGNFTTMTRGGAPHIYVYFDSTNRVKRVSGWSMNPGWPSVVFAYDNNGNMVMDSSKLMYEVRYDYRNLMTLAELASDGYADTLQFYYDGDGQRVKKVYSAWWETSRSCCRCDDEKSELVPL